MKIEIPKVLRELYVYEYDEAYSEVKLVVWVNPPRKRMTEYFDILKAIGQARIILTDEKAEPAAMRQAAEDLEALGEGVLEFWAEIWSQGEEDKRWTLDEVKALFAHTQENDPGLWQWLLNESLMRISEYRGGQKKALRLRSGI